MKLYWIFKITGCVMAVIAWLYPTAFGTSVELKWILTMFIFLLAIDIKLDALQKDGE